ncbi:GntR family transcriptional regulator [Paraburkholderia sp. BCC1885]|uniref:GntR family transcriptional regulator n=1 Tax=Paraburkholderia sp. BCC1885 TaxID=2562669 RepID=UPI0011823824|nr:GntR family transcriptional regulator [Paraburkholderia sp. BCC1885]
MDIALQHTNLRDQALAVLKLRLVSGDIAPGKIYSAAALATELGVSNSPVREAMLTLVNEGLMETVKNRGFRVVPISDKERRNIYELRKLIEVPAMSKLATMHKKIAEHSEELHTVAASMVEFAKSGDIVSYLGADRNFHLTLLGFLENERLTSIVENLREQSRQYGLKALSARGELAKSAEGHKPLLEAILAGDKKLVTKLMTDHISHLISDWAN